MLCIKIASFEIGAKQETPFQIQLNYIDEQYEIPAKSKL